MVAKPSPIVAFPGRAGDEPGAEKPARPTPPRDHPAPELLISTWMSPAFPVGAFSYSHGLETAIADNRLANAATVADWIGLLLERGSGWNDAILLSEAWRAGAAMDAPRLRDLAELAEAMSPSRERRAETLDLGAAFLRSVEAGWPHDVMRGLVEAVGSRVAYPVAVGLAASTHRVPAVAALNHFLNAFAANLVSVAVRLVPLGQSDGLGIISRLQPRLLAVAERALTATLDELGSAAVQSDIASMRHETLYSRVFRS